MIGTVIWPQGATVRTSPTVSAPAVRVLRKGDKIDIISLKTGQTEEWAQVPDGWVATKYGGTVRVSIESADICVIERIIIRLNGETYFAENVPLKKITP